jgi:hypothetical protein
MQLAPVDPAVEPVPDCVTTSEVGTAKTVDKAPTAELPSMPTSPPMQLTAEADALGGAMKNAAGATVAMTSSIASGFVKRDGFMAL